MDVEIRTIRQDEFEAFHGAIAAAFGGDMDPVELEKVRKVSEIERMLAAFDGPDIVGGTAAASFRLTVPGAVLPAAGITTVGVKPTHHRRGVNTALMRRQLDDLHEGGEAVSILTASEGGIYGRYGYGLASFECAVDIERERTSFIRGYQPSGRFRLLEREAALEAFPSVYERVRPQAPGLLERSRDWWDLILSEFHEEGKDRYVFFAVHESGDGVDAYAAYRIKHDWPGEVPTHTLTVAELMATTPQAYADMWRFCFDVDLIHSIRAWSRPVDDPLLHILAEPRRLRMTVRDQLWLRVVDVTRALAGRRYAASDGLVLEVHDGFCPWNEGRYELVGGPDGAGCRRTDASPDVVLGATELGAVYLGGTTFGTLRRAGRISEETPGALWRADVMFGWDRAPWCGHHF